MLLTGCATRFVQHMASEPESQGLFTNEVAQLRPQRNLALCSCPINVQIPGSMGLPGVRAVLNGDN